MSDRGRSSPNRPALAVAHALAVVLLVGSGLVHGRLTDRWGTSAELTAAIARLDRVPRRIGDWRGQDVAMDRRQIETAAILGYLSRSYRNSRDGSEVSILVVCGRPGPISVHTPDVCYQAAGYAAESEPVPESLTLAGGRPVHFLKARFHETVALLPKILDIRWTWNAQGLWETPATPRVQFATQPFLYKVYLIVRRDESATRPTSETPETSDKLGPAVAIFEAIDRALSVEGPPDAEAPLASAQPTSG